ncbi:hypothetical protein LJC63_10935 [Ruminococcaceae bacterium OttesenSCG-928-L11]|nr:hypothetical protein [Ruminococcaceae bacterium OttesenSCG-928-L11]
MENMLYPTDVQTIVEDDGRQIIKTYTLSDGEDPAYIPRDSFELDGWRYELAEIIQSKASSADSRPHTETVEIETDSNDLNEIMEQLSPTLEHESADGYCGLLTLDLASVKCEAISYNNSGYTVTTTREYVNLPANDLYFIPKTITENGRSLALDSVEWEVQGSTNVGYTDIPSSYRAIAKYTGSAVQSIATGYVTTADYTGEITRESAGSTVYVAHFAGTPVSSASEESEPASTPAQDKAQVSIPVATMIGIFAIIALLGGAAAFLFLRHNVKVYSIGEDGQHDLVAKVRISAKNPVIDLTALNEVAENRRFRLEIDKLAAKSLNGTVLDAVFGPAKLHHKIAYEGNIYRIEADFHTMTIKAIY